MGRRFLGLDLGSVRIGLAISDDRGRVAVPYGTIKAGAPEDVKAIARLVRDQDIGEVVVGHPRTLTGERGDAAMKAETFAGALAQFLDVPVHLHDERLSTVEAERELARAGSRGARRRRSVDASAATVILQSYLDGLGGAGPPG